MSDRRSPPGLPVFASHTNHAWYPSLSKRTVGWGEQGQRQLTPTVARQSPKILILHVPRLNQAVTLSKHSASSTTSRTTSSSGNVAKGLNEVSSLGGSRSSVTCGGSSTAALVLPRGPEKAPAWQVGERGRYEGSHGQGDAACDGQDQRQQHLHRFCGEWNRAKELPSFLAWVSFFWSFTNSSVSFFVLHEFMSASQLSVFFQV